MLQLIEPDVRIEIDLRVAKNEFVKKPKT